MYSNFANAVRLRDSPPARDAPAQPRDRRDPRRRRCRRSLRRIAALTPVRFAAAGVLCWYSHRSRMMQVGHFGARAVHT